MLCTVNFTEELTGRAIQRVVGTNVQKQHIQLKNVKQHNLVMVIISLIQVDPKLVENKDSKFIKR